MADVVAARDAYIAARARAAETRRELGRAISEARQQNIAQEAIAKRLRLTREQIRRYQREYERWAAQTSTASS